MPHHVAVGLPDGRVACADWRDTAVVKAMRTINEWVSTGRSPERYPAAAFDAVAGWLDENATQSVLCRDSLSPAALGCGHD